MAGIWLVLSALIMVVILIIFYFKCGTLPLEDIPVINVRNSSLKNQRITQTYRV